MFSTLSLFLSRKDQTRLGVYHIFFVFTFSLPHGLSSWLCFLRSLGALSIPLTLQPKLMHACWWFLAEWRWRYEQEKNRANCKKYYQKLKEDPQRYRRRIEKINANRKRRMLLQKRAAIYDATRNWQPTPPKKRKKNTCDKAFSRLEPSTTDTNNYRSNSSSTSNYNRSGEMEHHFHYVIRRAFFKVET